MRHNIHDPITGRFTKEIIMADETIPTPIEPIRDVMSYRVIVWTLGIALVSCVGSMIALPLLGKELPSEVMTLATLLTGGFLAFLNPQAATGSK
jgi:hypothetical protein